MSGARSRHLERRCGIYGVRVRVPDDIRTLIGLVEVRRSLRTSDLLRARAQSALIAVRLFEVFEMVRQHSDCVTWEDVEAFIGHIFDQVLRKRNPGVPLLSAEARTAPVRSAGRIGRTVGEAIGA